MCWGELHVQCRTGTNKRAATICAGLEKSTNRLKQQRHKYPTDVEKCSRENWRQWALVPKKWKVSEHKQPMWIYGQLRKRKLSYIFDEQMKTFQIFSFWTNQMIVQVCWQTLPFFVFLTPQLVLQIQVPGGGWGCVGGTVRTVGDCELVCGTAFTFIDAILSVHWGTSLQVKEKVDKRYWRLDLDLVNSLCWKENRRCSRVDTRAWTVLDDLIDKHTIEWDKCKCCSAMERERGEGVGRGT